MYIGLEPRREGYLGIGSSSFMLSVTVYRSCGLHGWDDLPFPGERLVGTSSCFRQYRVWTVSWAWGYFLVGVCFCYTVSW